MKREETVRIKDEYIKLQDAIKFGGAVETGGMAKLLIQSGKVKVNGEVCAMRGKKLRAGDCAETDGVKIYISK